MMAMAVRGRSEPLEEGFGVVFISVFGAFAMLRQYIGLNQAGRHHTINNQF
jgi:hypothetical protein